jgi:hypothetical protein
MLLLTLEAVFALVAFDLLGLGRNFDRLHRYVSRWKVSQRRATCERVEQISQAVKYACVIYPRAVLCLQRSAVMTCLLRSWGVPAQMVIGAQHLPFKAHAWTEVNGRAIDEKRDVHKIYGVWDRC